MKIFDLPSGTPVKIKQSIICNDIYHKGGRLVFQKSNEVKDDEFEYGIEVANGVCFEFYETDYELINNKNEK